LSAPPHPTSWPLRLRLGLWLRLWLWLWLQWVGLWLQRLWLYWLWWRWGRRHAAFPRPAPREAGDFKVRIDRPCHVAAPHRRSVHTGQRGTASAECTARLRPVATTKSW
jgi:hypothetical protein